MYFRVVQQSRDALAFQVVLEGERVGLTSVEFRDQAAVQRAIEAVVASLREGVDASLQVDGDSYFFTLRGEDGELLARGIACPNPAEADAGLAEMQRWAATGERFRVVNLTRPQKSGARPVDTIQVAVRYDLAACTKAQKPGLELLNRASDGLFTAHVHGERGEVLLYLRGFTTRFARDEQVESVLVAAADPRRYDRREAEGRRYFVLTARNGREIARSPWLAGEAECDAAIAQLVRLAPVEAKEYGAARTRRKVAESGYDLTRRSTSGGAGFEAFKAEDGHHYFHFNDERGEALLFSHGYSTPKARDHGIRSLLKGADDPACYRVAGDELRFAISAVNGRELARSRLFDSRAALDRAVAWIRREAVPLGRKYGIRLWESSFIELPHELADEGASAQDPDELARQALDPSRDASLSRLAAPSTLRAPASPAPPSPDAAAPLPAATDASPRDATAPASPRDAATDSSPRDAATDSSPHSPRDAAADASPHSPPDAAADTSSHSPPDASHETSQPDASEASSHPPPSDASPASDASPHSSRSTSLEPSHSAASEASPHSPSEASREASHSAASEASPHSPRDASLEASHSAASEASPHSPLADASPLEASQPAASEASSYSPSSDAPPASDASTHSPPSDAPPASEASTHSSLSASLEASAQPPRSPTSPVSDASLHASREASAVSAASFHSPASADSPARDASSHSLLSGTPPASDTGEPSPSPRDAPSDSQPLFVPGDSYADSFAQSDASADSLDTHDSSLHSSAPTPGSHSPAPSHPDLPDGALPEPADSLSTPSSPSPADSAEVDAERSDLQRFDPSPRRSDATRPVAHESEPPSGPFSARELDDALAPLTALEFDDATPIVLDHHDSATFAAASVHALPHVPLPEDSLTIELDSTDLSTFAPASPHRPPPPLDPHVAHAPHEPDASRFKSTPTSSRFDPPFALAADDPPSATRPQPVPAPAFARSQPTVSPAPSDPLAASDDVEDSLAIALDPPDASTFAAVDTARAASILSGPEQEPAQPLAVVDAAPFTLEAHVSGSGHASAEISLDASPPNALTAEAETTDDPSRGDDSLTLALDALEAPRAAEAFAADPAPAGRPHPPAPPRPLATSDDSPPLDATDAPQSFDAPDAPQPLDAPDAPQSLDATDAPQPFDATDAPQSLDARVDSRSLAAAAFTATDHSPIPGETQSPAAADAAIDPATEARHAPDDSLTRALDSLDLAEPLPADHPDSPPLASHDLPAVDRADSTPRAPHDLPTVDREAPATVAVASAETGTASHLTGTTPTLPDPSSRRPPSPRGREDSLTRALDALDVSSDAEPPRAPPSFDVASIPLTSRGASLTTTSDEPDAATGGDSPTLEVSPPALPDHSFSVAHSDSPAHELDASPLDASPPDPQDSLTRALADLEASPSSVAHSDSPPHELDASPLDASSPDPQDSLTRALADLEASPSSDPRSDSPARDRDASPLDASSPDPQDSLTRALGALEVEAADDRDDSRLATPDAPTRLHDDTTTTDETESHRLDRIEAASAAAPPSSAPPAPTRSREVPASLPFSAAPPHYAPEDPAVKPGDSLTSLANLGAQDSGGFRHPSEPIDPADSLTALAALHSRHLPSRSGLDPADSLAHLQPSDSGLDPADSLSAIAELEPDASGVYPRPSARPELPEASPAPPIDPADSLTALAVLDPQDSGSPSSPPPVDPADSLTALAVLAPPRSGAGEPRLVPDASSIALLARATRVPAPSPAESLTSLAILEPDDDESAISHREFSPIVTDDDESDESFAMAATRAELADPPAPVAESTLAAPQPDQSIVSDSRHRSSDPPLWIQPPMLPALEDAAPLYRLSAPPQPVHHGPLILSIPLNDPSAAATAPLGDEAVADDSRRAALREPAARPDSRPSIRPLPRPPSAGSSRAPSRPNPASDAPPSPSGDSAPPRAASDAPPSPSGDSSRPHPASAHSPPARGSDTRPSSRPQPASSALDSAARPSSRPHPIILDSLHSPSRDSATRPSSRPYPITLDSLHSPSLDSATRPSSRPHPIAPSHESPRSAPTDSSTRPDSRPHPATPSLDSPLARPATPGPEAPPSSLDASPDLPRESSRPHPARDADPTRSPLTDESPATSANHPARDLPSSDESRAEPTSSPDLAIPLTEFPSAPVGPPTAWIPPHLPLLAKPGKPGPLPPITNPYPRPFIPPGTLAAIGLANRPGGVGAASTGSAPGARPLVAPATPPAPAPVDSPAEPLVAGVLPDLGLLTAPEPADLPRGEAPALVPELSVLLQDVPIPSSRRREGSAPLFAARREPSSTHAVPTLLARREPSSAQSAPALVPALDALEFESPSGPRPRRALPNLIPEPGAPITVILERPLAERPPLEPPRRALPNLIPEPGAPVSALDRTLVAEAERREPPAGDPPVPKDISSSSPGAPQPVALHDLPTLLPVGLAVTQPAPIKPAPAPVLPTEVPVPLPRLPPIRMAPSARDRWLWIGVVLAALAFLGAVASRLHRGDEPASEVAELAFPPEPPRQAPPDEPASPPAEPPREPTPPAVVPPSLAGATIHCPEAADPALGLLVAPFTPRVGEPLRIFAATLDDDISLGLHVLAGDGAPAEALDARVHLGTPSSAVARFTPATAGEYTFAVVRDGVAVTCSKVQVLTEPPQRPPFAAKGRAWAVERAWTAGEEALYSAWVRELFAAPRGETLSLARFDVATADPARNLLHDALGLHEDLQDNPLALRLRPDGADLPYVVRAYWSWKRRLPFAYRKCQRGGDGKAPRCGDARTNLEPGPGFTMPATELARVQRFFHRNLGWGVQAGNARTAVGDSASDLYPVRLDHRGLRPGAIYADPYGHVFFIVDLVPAQGGQPGALLAVDGQPDGGIVGREFWEGVFLWSTEPAHGGVGFKQFRPVVRQPGGGLVQLGDAALVGAPELGDIWTDHGELAGTAFFDAVRALLEPPPWDASRQQHEAVAAFAELARSRVEPIDRAAEFARGRTRAIAMPKGWQVFEATGAWESHSTPGRDLRLLAALDVVRGLPDRVRERPALYVTGGDPEARARALADELDVLLRDPQHAITYTRSDGSPWTLTLRDLADREAALERAYNPNDCPELRWGAPEGSDELATCSFRAPADQHARMEAYRGWLQRRRPPARGDKSP